VCADLNLEEVKSAKMLKRMKLLEQAGPKFAEKPINAMPIIGALVHSCLVVLVARSSLDCY
jgi:hypothetical protein